MMQFIMQSFKSFLSSRLGISIIGLLALLSLGWLVCHLIGVTSIKIRLLLITILIMMFIVTILNWAWLIKHYEKILYRLLKSRQKEISGRKLEVEALKDKVNEAISSLKRSSHGLKFSTKASLYRLPWYLVIGAAASGKSTLLRQSGLHFPFANRDEIQGKGLGGTEQCDWWSADEAIFLDTAGCYMTEADNAEEWSAFLSLLKKSRSKLPINGVIVTVSLVELLMGDDEAVAWQANLIRERVAVLYKQLGFLFPIYLVFTKCDLLKGFEEFFAYLSNRERNQAWGVTPRHSTECDSAEKDILQKLEALYHKLCQIRSHQFTLVYGVLQKLDMFEFPEQFIAALSRLNSFVKTLLKQNVYQESPNICGIFFSSSTQNGAIIECAVGDPKQSFDYVLEAKQSTKNKISQSYFIKDLFSNIIVKQNSAIARNKKNIIWSRWLNNTGVMVCIVLISSMILFSSVALESNSQLLKRGVNVLQQFRLGTHRQQVSEFSRLYDLMGVFNYYSALVNPSKTIPFYRRLGLYRGGTQLTAFNHLLTHLLTPLFIQPVVSALEKKLKDYSIIWANATVAAKHQLRGEYYATLHAYLMLGFPAQLKVDAINDFIASTWRCTLSNVEQDTGKIISEFTAKAISLFYLNELASHNDAYSVDKITIKPQLISIARHQLYSPASASNLYAKIIADQNRQSHGVSLAQLIDNAAKPIFVDHGSIAGSFTQSIWRNKLAKQITALSKAELQGDWVIETPLVNLSESDLPLMKDENNVVEQRQVKRLINEAHQLYFSDYVSRWCQALTSLSLPAFDSLDDTLKQLHALVDPEGPIPQLLKIFSQNITMFDASNPDDHPAELAEIADQLSGLVSNTTQHKPSELVLSYLHELAAVESDIERLALSAEPQREARQYAMRLLSLKASETSLYHATLTVDNILKQIGNHQLKRALRAVLLAPMVNTWRAILHEAKKDMNHLWQSEVMPSYRELIAGKFPFASRGQDLSLIDMSDFMRPQQGILSRFINERIKPFIYRDQQGWHERLWLGVGAGFSPLFLQNINTASTISEVFFRHGRNDPNLDLRIYPQPTPGLSQIILETGGQTIDYKNGPQEWYSLHWPGNAANEETLLRGVTTNDLDIPILENQGVWGLFRLLDRAATRDAANQTLVAQWTLPSPRGKRYKIGLIIGESYRGNVFYKILHSHFQLPSQLFSS